MSEDKDLPRKLSALPEKSGENIHDKNLNSPEWHKNVLAQREQMLKEGKE